MFDSWACLPVCLSPAAVSRKRYALASCGAHDPLELPLSHDASMVGVPPTQNNDRGLHFDLIFQSFFVENGKERSFHVWWEGRVGRKSNAGLEGIERRW